MSNLPFQTQYEEKADYKPPFLRFEDGHEKDNEASLKAGRAVFKPVVRVFIRARGDDKCEVPYIVEQESIDPKTGKPNKIYPWIAMLKEKVHHGFKVREELEYCERALDHWRQTQQVLVEGTPLNEWQLITKAQAENLKACDILSVEQCAEMGEECMTNYGLGARDLKKKARSWLSANTDPGKAAEQISELSAKSDQQAQRLEELAQSNSAYEDKIRQLEAKMAEDALSPKEETPVPAMPTEFPELDYRSMDRVHLAKLAQEAGHSNAGPHWAEDILIDKIKNPK